MKNSLIVMLLFAAGSTFAQTPLPPALYGNLEDHQPDRAYENVHVEKLNENEQASTFVIWVKESVAEHYHEAHTEIVYVLEGTGTMTLGEEVMELKPGDYIFIPKGTHHSVVVTSEDPMKVISIQTPQFDGSDRHFVTQ